MFKFYDFKDTFVSVQSTRKHEQSTAKIQLCLQINEFISAEKQTFLFEPDEKSQLCFIELLKPQRLTSDQ